MPDVSTPAATAPPTVRGEAAGPWREAWLTALRIWAVAEATYLLIAAAVGTITGEIGSSGFLHLWMRWDTGHYVTIASQGYSPVTENPAFFPLYPLLMALVDPVVPGDGLLAGLVVASAACITAIAVLYRLAEDLYGQAVAGRAALALMGFPYAFYLVAAYNESLFLALAVGSLYAMRRGHWWTAGALAGLSTATRQAGILLALAFAIEYLRQRDWQPTRIRWNALAILLVPTGLAAYMIYSAHVLGDPLAFLHAQSFWGRALAAPWTGTIGALQHLGVHWSEGLNSWFVLTGLLDLATLPVVVTLLVLSVAGRWRLGPESWLVVAFGWAVFGTVLLSPLGAGLPGLHGLPRYALEFLPIFIVLARMCVDPANRVAGRVYLALAASLQLVLLAAFLHNVWLS